VTHSFFGKEVGCRNEGLDTFMQRKTVEIMQGSDVALKDYYDANIVLENVTLNYGLNNSYTSLFPNIGLDNPEFSFSIAPYEKGAQFVYFMETLIGKKLIPALLKQYLTTFSQRAIGHRDFQRLYNDFVTRNFDAAVSAKIINRTNWDKWVLKPGLPPVKLNFTSVLRNGVATSAGSALALTRNKKTQGHQRHSLLL
jgi:leukotriene-A4 hydrolase